MYGNKGKMLIPVTVQWEFKSSISSQLYIEKNPGYHKPCQQDSDRLTLTPPKGLIEVVQRVFGAFFSGLAGTGLLQHVPYLPVSEEGQGLVNIHSQTVDCGRFNTTVGQAGRRTGWMGYNKMYLVLWPEDMDQRGLTSFYSCSMHSRASLQAYMCSEEDPRQVLTFSKQGEPNVQDSKMTGD